MKNYISIIILSTAIMITGCSDNTNSMQVTATAYTSHAGETDDTPTLAAWNEHLKPGMKAIAVSRDLLKAGLTHGTEVSIEGLSGTYQVLDKMNKRWTKRIDIYMGIDTDAARKWGKQTVVIHWDDKQEN